MADTGNNADRGGGFKPAAESESSGGDINVMELVMLLWRKKFLCLVVVASCSVWAYFKTVLAKSYVARSQLMVQKAENSALQSVAADFGSVSGRSSFFGARDGLVEKYMTYLQTRDFSLEAAPIIYPHLKPWELKPIFQTQKLRYAKGVRGLAGQILPPTFPYIKRIDDYVARQPVPVLNVEGLSKILPWTGNFSKIGISGIAVSVTTPDPGLSVKMANLLAVAAIDVLTRRETKELDEARNFVRSKVREERAELELIKNRLLIARKKYLASGGSNSEEIAKRISIGVSDVESARLKIDENRRTIETLTDGVNRASMEKSKSDSAGSAEYGEALRRQLDALSERRANMLAEGLSPRSKRVTDLDREIKKTGEKLTIALSAAAQTRKPATGAEIFSGDLDLSSKLQNLARENILLSAKIESGAKMLERLRSSQMGLPEFESANFELMKAWDVQNQHYIQLTHQLFQIEMQKISVQNRVSIVENASGDQVSVIPSLQSNVVSTNLMGMMGLFFVLFLWDKSHPRIRKLKDLKALEVPTFSSIPDLKKSRILSTNRRVFLHPYVINHQVDTPQSVAFKYVRTKILQMPVSATRRPVRVISIHSSLPHEGKTFLSINIAASLAASGKRVVLVDGDLRVRAATDVFVRKSVVGLSTVLAHGDPIEYVTMTNTGIANLDFIPAGKYFEQSTELLSSPAYAQLLQQLKETYDFIVVDTPPTLPVPDGAIIGGHSDLLLLAVMAGSTLAGDVLASLERLTNGARGTVMALLNKSEAPSRSYYYYRKRNFMGISLGQDSQEGEQIQVKAPTQSVSETKMTEPRPPASVVALAPAPAPAPFRPTLQPEPLPANETADGPSAKKDDGSSSAA